MEFRWSNNKLYQNNLGMINTYKKIDVDTFLNTLKEDGVFIIEDFLTKEELVRLTREVKSTHQKSGLEYKFGSVYNTGALNNLKYKSAHYQLFNKSWMFDLFFKYNNGVTKGYGQDIYSTHDFKFDGSLARNGYLHFDRNHALKYFVYLNDTTEENAAFFIQPKSHVIGKKLRINQWNGFFPKPNESIFNKIFRKIFSKKYEHIRNRIELDFKEYFNENEIIAVEQKEGSLIVFDSDCFHRGGLIKKQGLERLIIRMHNHLSF